MFLVGVEAQLRIGTKDPPELRLLQSAHKVKATDSDTRSLGYDSMKTLSEAVSLTNISSKNFK